MRFSHLIFIVAALALAMVQPAHAEENVSGPVYIVTYFDVAPTTSAESAGIVRHYAEASREEDGNTGIQVFQEIGRPSRFAILEAWRDKKASDAHSAAAAATAFRDKMQPLLLGGFGVRPHSGLSVATSNAQFPSEAVFVITHVDVFPVHKDPAIELVKAQTDAARKGDGNLRFDVLQWDGHPNHFTLVEAWRDRKAFDASVTAATAKDFRQKLTPLEGALYDERLYQLVR